MMNPSQVVQSLQQTFHTGITKSITFREAQLKAFLKMLEENTAEIIQVLASDLHKSKMETIVMEVKYLVNDLKNTIANLKSWSKPERPSKNLVDILDSLYIYSEPYGVVLVVGAWNYPIQLTLLPVAGAIAAGNCVVIKPSEIAPAAAKFMAVTIPKYLDSRCYYVYEGGVSETTALLKERFDYIFFTGATNVGRIIHSAANKHLTPVTLELGGKSPVYLDDTVDVKVATKRILWGKCINAGQTCVAPDYLICTKNVRDKFLNCAKDVLVSFYGKEPKKSPDYGRIINDRQFQRLKTLLKDQHIVLGGTCDVDERFIEPTIVIDIESDNVLMQEEIFGPILPVVTVSNIDEAIEFIRAKEKPLVTYIFSNSEKVVNLIINNVSSGGVLVNDTLMHMVTDLPFGGVGYSGMGMYHGKYTFDTFSHKKSCLYKNLGFLGEALGSSRYPPYTEGKLRFLNFLLQRRQSFLSRTCIVHLFIFFVGFTTASLYKHYF